MKELTKFEKAMKEFADMEFKELVEARDKALGEYKRLTKLVEDTCTHPKDTLEVEYKSDIGNYSPSEDAYWVNINCPMCKCMWVADSEQDREVYNNPTMVSKEG